MKAIYILSALAGTALSTPPPLPSHPFVTVSFSDDLSGTPAPLSVNVPANKALYDITEGGPGKCVSSVQLVDQSHASLNFECRVKVSGPFKYEGTLTSSHTFLSFGKEVLLNSVSVTCDNN
ncbi:hypothetical protein N7478_011959 [Penicillium angulare]|uniref:uncharacterized protein n=1 Tax=Penicillium angulare TaxID=116970 RepID=UPI0025420220|nr:uncharacterized protein N7478_011959 [Penicillium angulare]KAJ5261364.1 hypothetical protein N7478_011959 [Penicillium angulare]